MAGQARSAVQLQELGARMSERKKELQRDYYS
jgi:hypothetical protein